MRPRPPERLVRFCGADCSACETYQRFLAGDESGIVNQETGYRCCWLPGSYPWGHNCPIRVCAEERGTLFCGACGQLEQCATMEAFYSQPGYNELRRRMFDEIERRKEKTQ